MLQPQKKVASKAEAKPPKPPVIDEVDLPEDEESAQLNQELEQGSEETQDEQVPPQPVKRPFYSVPYTYRAPVANVGPGQAKPVDTSVPPARAGGIARRVADNGDSGGQVVARIEPDSSGGSAGGTIVPPPSDEAVGEGVDEAVDEGVAADEVAYEEEFSEGEGASGSVTRRSNPKAVRPAVSPAGLRRLHLSQADRHQVVSQVRFPVR